MVNKEITIILVPHQHIMSITEYCFSGGDCTIIFISLTHGVQNRLTQS